MTNTPSTQRVALNSFDIDDKVQPRPRLDRDAVKRYALVYRANQDALPPILLGQLPSGSLILIDGFHRLEAARKADLWELPAHIVSTDEAKVPWLAVDANLRHGVPLRRPQRRMAFQRFVDAEMYRKANGGVLSSRELSQALPVASHQTMLDWMRKDYPAIYAEMVGDDPDEIEMDDRSEEDALRQQAMDNVEWTQREFAMSLRKATKIVPLDELAAHLRETLRKLEEAIGRPVMTATEAMDFIHNGPPNEDF